MDIRSLHRWQHAISLDPGVSTGIVLADWPVEVLGAQPPSWESVVWTSTTIRDSSLQGWLTERGTRFVRECQFRGEPVVAIIERPPQRAREPGGAARLVREWLGVVGCAIEVCWIGPGEWKPWVKATPVPKTSIKPRTPHERDARAMLWYWLNVKERNR